MSERSGGDGGDGGGDRGGEVEAQEDWDMGYCIAEPGLGELCQHTRERPTERHVVSAWPPSLDYGVFRGGRGRLLR